MLTLYHAPRSRSSRILWLLEEIGAPYEVRHVSIRRTYPPSGEPDPTNPHPDKKVPALVHDGALVTESGAICLYLTDAFPEAQVGFAVGEARRSDYLRWLFAYQGVIEPTISLRFGGVEGFDPGAAWGSLETVERAMLSALRDGPFLLGERFTAADVLIGSLGQWARRMLPADTVVDDYIARLSARPAFQRALAKDEPAGKGA